MRPHGNSDTPDEMRSALAREAWHTARRENVKNYEQVATPLKWAGILTYVIDYQNKHNGMSPTDQMIAKGTMLSAGQVQYHLREMEKEGLVADRKGWPRMINVTAVAKVQKLTAMENYEQAQAKEAKTKEARIMDTSQLGTNDLTTRGTPRQKSYRGRKPFMTRARQIAEAVMDHYDQYGTAPNGKWIRERVFSDLDGSAVTTTSSNLSRHIQQMVDLGWLYHTPRYHRDYALTGLGRAALFGQIDEPLHTDTPINPSEAYRGQTAAANKVAMAKSPEWRSERSRKAAAARWGRQQPSIPRDTGYAKTEVRRAAPPISPPPQQVEDFVPSRIERFVPTPLKAGNLSEVADVDLVIELTGRGFKVSR